MTEKRLNPYDRLKMAGNRILREIVYFRRRIMLEINVESRSNALLSDIYQRVLAAEQLDHEVVVLINGPKLRFEYRSKRPDTIPFEFDL